MSFLSLIIKNLLRQKVRAGLTLLGISVGITTVVALGAITSGFRASSGGMITARGSDFMVAQDGASDLTFSTIQTGDVPKLAAVPGVAWAEGSLFHITRAGSNLYFFLAGIAPADVAANPPDMRAGDVFRSEGGNPILLGEGAASDLGVGVGGTVTIDDRTFTVAGIYRSKGLFENNGAYAPLSVVAEMTSKPGVVSVVHIKVAEGYRVDQVAKAIESTIPTLATIASVDDIGKVDQGIKLLDAANIAISILAVGIGAIGVMNTMVMSVFERTREIGIFRAVGWSGMRVMRMIVTESLVLCAVAAALGTAAGIAVTKLVTLVPAVERLLEPQYGLSLFVRAVAVAVIVALVGAAYPAIRAVRLTPLEALRYE